MSPAGDFGEACELGVIFELWARNSYSYHLSNADGLSPPFAGSYLYTWRCGQTIADLSCHNSELAFDSDRMDSVHRLAFA